MVTAKCGPYRRPVLKDNALKDNRRLFPLPIASRCRLRLTTWGAANTEGISIPKRGSVMNRWLEYDLVVLAVLVFGIAAVEFLAMIF